MALATTSSDLDALRAAIESDRAYFELGATVEEVEGARIAWLPGLAANPGAIVVHRVTPGQITAAGIADIEARLRKLGTTLARIYLDEADTLADDVLRRAGYAPRAEIAFAGSVSATASAECTIAPIGCEDDWARKQRFHEETSERPDGHGAPASEWVAIERMRCGPAGMEPFLCTIGNEAVGAVNVMAAGPLLRLKNIVTHPAHRRNRIGLAMVRFGMELARQRGYRGICLFAVAGDAGERLYRSAGLIPVGEQIEWSRALA